MVKKQSGFSMLELVVAMAIFGGFLLLLTSLTAQMRQAEQRHPVDFMSHPQISAVLSRLRKDVLDAHGPDPYLESHDGYVQSPTTLLIESVQENGGVQKIVWDFSRPGEAHRRAYNVGVVTEWVARGLPADFSSELEIDAVELPDRPWGVRIVAKDSGGNVAIDQVLQPRAHD